MFSKGESTGHITFIDGKQIWSIIECTGDTASVRYEDGWYGEHKSNGESICSGVILRKDGTEERVKGRDIVGFISDQV